MAKKLVKRCSTLLAKRKTTVKYHLIPTKMAKIRKTENNKRWWGYGEMGTHIVCLQKCKVVQPLWKTVWQFIQVSNTELQYDPAIPLLGTYPREMEAYVPTKTCTWMFTATLFLKAKRWGGGAEGTTTWWINKVCPGYSIEYYSAIKRNEVLAHATAWLSLKTFC